jgi:uncharacterized Zn finger protein
MAWFNGRFPVSMTVAERKAKALRAAEKLGRKQSLDPVVIEGPLAVTWWGKAWNHNLEGYADYSNRLPRGRSYARHGSVIDLRVEAGLISARVQGSQSRPYEVKISIVAMDANARALLIEACAGKLDSAEALLGGRFPEDMTRLLTAEKMGLFPQPRGIRFSCSCPDSANLCKHVAATLYGVGARLDRDPALFFLLRKIELEDLVSQAVKEETQKLLQAKGTGESVLMDEGDGELAALFGIDLNAAGEKRFPAKPVMQAETDRPATKKTKENAFGKAREKAFRYPRERDLQMPAKENSRARKDQNAIQDALQALETLSKEIHRLESELKSLFK